LKNETDNRKIIGIGVLVLYISVFVLVILGLVIAPKAEFLLFMGLAIIIASIVLFLDKDTLAGGVAVTAIGVTLLGMYFLA
jgi:hypothetical protein